MSAVVEPEQEQQPRQAEAGAQHPWLGLDSFTEETKQYFHGRDEEVAELARRVQRTVLTVLFGQSGLGKTSILRAGIVPRLRPLGFCPVYVRVDYSADAPSPSEQIKQAIFRATETSGEWSRPGAAIEGESLWEFLHHRDDVLRDADGKELLPLLIFDQFEEIFTLAQADEAGRERAREFITDLADLAENRPPKAMDARMEIDDSLTERFDFARCDYRILIALREDYLAHLEGVKREMPSITQNRMRLARMNGAQALAAVMKPGGKLVSQEVAEAVVRFVAGGSELPNAEVEPSLLSLICRELNNARIAQGRDEISADLLAGSHDTILAEFYERALFDQPPEVRKIIESELLTDSGYRENLAEERLQKAFVAAGAAPDALATLVNRRLLRIEERLDVRRVELTHDVLCGVVRASRELRLEREALEAAEQRLAEQRERERTTRKSLARARRIALACALLAVGAVVSAAFAYLSTQRAQRAEADALAVRQLADASRGEAEKLVAYLLDDFYAELAPVGRLDALGNLAKSTVAYYAELPAELRTPVTQRRYAQALLQRANVLMAQGAAEEAGKNIDDAEKIAEGIRAGGDASPDAAFAFASARLARGNFQVRRLQFAPALQAFDEGAAALAPVLLGSPPPRTSQLALDLAVGASSVKVRLNDKTARESFQKARELARSLNALDLTNLPASESYLVASFRLAEYDYFFQGVTDKAVELATEVGALADRVLERRPEHRAVLRLKASAANLLATIDYDSLRLKQALPRFLEQHSLLERLVALDTTNIAAWITLGQSKTNIAGLLRDLARTDDSLRWVEEAVAISSKIKLDAQAARSFAFWSGSLANWYRNMGQAAKAEAALAQMRGFAAKAMTGTDSDRTVRISLSIEEARDLEAQGRHADAYALADKTAEEIRARVKGRPPGQGDQYYPVQLIILGSAQGLGNYAAAEAAARELIRLREKPGVASYITQVSTNQAAAELALVLVRQGKLDEAQKILRPLIPFYRQKQLVEADDKERQVQRARFLMIVGLAFPAERKARLSEAAALFASLPAPIRHWKEFAAIGDEIARELARS